MVERVGADSYAWQLLGAAREHTAQRSPLELQINRLLRLMVVVMVPLAAALVWALERRDTPFRESVATATAGIVTLIPEGLVLLTSLTFAVAAVRLSRRGMLVQYLNAVESLANVDTVCLDKTGTLTDGDLSLRAVVPTGNGAEAASARLAGYAASAVSRNATLDAVAAGLPGDRVTPQAEVPFSSRWKWSALQLDGEWLVLGAPEVLLGEHAPASVAENAREGRRVLAFGVARSAIDPTDGSHPPPQIEPLAMVVLEERLRADAAETIAFLHRQGVSLKVMSGDSPATVAAVAARAGIAAGARVWDGGELPDDPVALLAAVRQGSVFSRLTPEHKRDLVNALSKDGAYVAMIGDGVNDVPAMKVARLAIALGSGAQMAKSVADSVLVTDSFAAVPAAIAEGRQIIQNVQRVAQLFVTKSVFAAFVIATFGLWTGEFPLLPRHLSLAATFTVGIPGFVLALDPLERAAGGRGSFLRRVARFAIPAGSVIAAAVLAAYLLERAVRVRSITDARTAAVTVFVALGLYLLLVLDAERMSASRAYAVGIASLVGALAAAYLGTLSAGPVRDFFALARPDLLDALIMILATVSGIRLMAWAGLSPYPQPPQTAPPEGIEAGAPPS